MKGDAGDATGIDARARELAKPNKVRGNFGELEDEVVAAIHGGDSASAFYVFEARYYELIALAEGFGGGIDLDMVPNGRDWERLTALIRLLRRLATETLMVYYDWNDLRPHGPVR